MKKMEIVLCPCDGNGSSSDEENSSDKKEESANGLCMSYRMLVTACACLSMCISSATQTSMSSALVCMIRKDNSGNTTHSSSMSSSSSSSISYSENSSTYQREQFSGMVSSSQSVHLDTNITSFDDQPWKLSWDTGTQSWAVASFFFGYYVMQIPAGVLSSKLGSKWVLVFSHLGTSILHLLTVPAAMWSLPAFYAIRALAGLTSCFAGPSSFSLVANWCPLQETSQLFGMTGAGLALGNSFSFAISLFACETTFQGGWPIVFYSIASIQILLVLVITIWVTSSPSNNRFISSRETNYILQNSAIGKKKQNKTHIPWKGILLSGPVYAFVFAQIGFEWVNYTMSTQLPRFLDDVLELRPFYINLLSSVPFLLTVPVISLTGRISDWLIERRYISTTTTRKINEAYCKIMTSVALFILGVFPPGDWISPFFANILLAVGLTGSYSGFMANAGDLSPAHVGFITALGQGLTMWIGFVNPLVTGYLTKDKTRSNWLTAFTITAAIEAVCLVLYFILGSGKLQPWAFLESEEKEALVESTKETDSLLPPDRRKPPSYGAKQVDNISC